MSLSQLLPEDDQPLRIKSIAEWLNVSDKTVRRLINHGKLKSVKMGGLRMVLRRDFRAYLQQLSQSGGVNV